MGESNSPPQFGKLLLYRLTNPALALRSFTQSSVASPYYQIKPLLKIAYVRLQK